MRDKSKASSPILKRLREFFQNEDTSKQEEKHVYKAIWNGEVLAESDRTIVVEGNQYFPPDSINGEYFHESNLHTTCPWKGLASYYDIQVNGEVNKDAAWYYPAPKEAAKQIKDYVAFWHGVKVQKVIDEQVNSASRI
jgi:uncharacterized protein (DUF427 family)